MVQLGEQLLTPEKGWKRIHIDEVLKSDVNNFAEVGIKTNIGYKYQYGLKTFVCKFTGTRLRLISTLNTTKYTFPSLPMFEIDQNNIPNQIGTKEKDILTWVGSVFIDCEFAGRIYTDFGNTDKNGQTMTLMFEKLDIPDGEHLLNISIFSLNMYAKSLTKPEDFDLEYFDIDQDGTIECFLYNEDYTREQLSKFINNNYKELVESYPNKYISCKVFYEGIYSSTDRRDRYTRFEYYFSDFKLIDKIPKVHPPRTNIYGTLYDLDDIFEIYDNNSSKFNKRLIKFSYDSIMIKNRLQYLLTEDIDWDNDFYKYQDKVEDQNIGKGEANVVINSAIIKTKFLIDLKNEGYFAGLSYWWGSNRGNCFNYIIRILYSKDNINWYTFNPTTREWELCQLEDINTKGIIQFGDQYGSPVFAITSKEYKSFFNGVSKIGVALGITPNKKQNINFFETLNNNIGFLSFLQSKSYEEISLFQYQSIYPYKPTCDTIYFIPIPNKNGKIQFLMKHPFTLIPDRECLYRLFESFDRPNNYNGLPLTQWRYMDFLNYKVSDLCHILLSAPNTKTYNDFSDPEYSEYLKYIRNHSEFKQSFLCYEGLYINDFNVTSYNNAHDPLYDYDWSCKAPHFNGWANQIHLDGCRYLWDYDYIPRLKITFEPIVNKNNIIKTNWRCIVCEHGV